MIKGKCYDKNSLDKLPQDVNTSSVSSRESDDVYGFFGELNPLSNFHPACFVYNNIKYHSSEQMIQYQKARLFGDKDTASSILQAATAVECKHLSKSIANYDHAKWKEEARLRCEEAIMAKFMQNNELRSYLLKTNTKRLVECCTDKLWGNGLPLDDNNCLSPNRWFSQGLLGEILEHV